MQSVQPAPGLYNRIQQRMELRREDKVLAKIVGFISRPAVAAAVIAFIILLNIFASVNFVNRQQKTAETLATNSLSSEYLSASAGLYNIETAEP